MFKKHSTQQGRLFQAFIGGLWSDTWDSIQLAICHCNQIWPRVRRGMMLRLAVALTLTGSIFPLFARGIEHTGYTVVCCGTHLQQAGHSRPQTKLTDSGFMPSKYFWAPIGY